MTDLFSLQHSPPRWSPAWPASPSGSSAPPCGCTSSSRRHRESDHRLRGFGAGLCGVEAAPCAALAAAVAADRRHRARRAAWRLVARLGAAERDPRGDRRFADRLRNLRPARPALAPVKAGGAPADAAVGFLKGVLGGVTGLAGILVT